MKRLFHVRAVWATVMIYLATLTWAGIAATVGNYWLNYALQIIGFMSVPPIVKRFLRVRVLLPTIVAMAFSIGLSIPLLLAALIRNNATPTRAYFLSALATAISIAAAIVSDHIWAESERGYSPRRRAP